MHVFFVDVWVPAGQVSPCGRISASNGLHRIEYGSQKLSDYFQFVRTSTCVCHFKKWKAGCSRERRQKNGHIPSRQKYSTGIFPNQTGYGEQYNLIIETHMSWYLTPCSCYWCSVAAITKGGEPKVQANELSEQAVNKRQIYFRNQEPAQEVLHTTQRSCIAIVFRWISKNSPGKPTNLVIEPFEEFCSLRSRKQIVTHVQIKQEANQPLWSFLEPKKHTSRHERRPNWRTSSPLELKTRGNMGWTNLAPDSLLDARGEFWSSLRQKLTAACYTGHIAPNSRNTVAYNLDLRRC